MPMDAREIESMIKAAIPDAEVTIRDLAGDGDHYAATVISASFRGKSRVQQHQIVYQSLQGPDGRRAARAGAADRGAGGLERRLGRAWRGTINAARCFARWCRTSTAASPTPNCSSTWCSRFAVTQISHTLLGRFTPLGALQTTLLFLGVWWLWVYTAWVTNWLDPELTPVRVLLFVLMLGGLVLSTSIPKAFESRGLWFALAYSAMQVGRTIFLLASTPSARPLARMNAIRILVWLVGVGGVLDRGRLCRRADAAGAVGGGARDRISVAGGAVLDSEIRRVVGRRLGGRRRPHGRALRRFHHHRARRIHRGDRGDLCRSDLDRRSMSWRFVSALIGSIAMWWIYFHKGAEAGSEQISKSSEPGRLARLAYTYLHMPIVAGIIVSAVADDLVLTHPEGHSDLRTVLCAIGGPLLFLVGTILFKHTFRGFLQLSHGAGIVALGVLCWFAGELSPLMLSIATTAIMIMVAVWESISLGSASAEASVGSRPAHEPRTCRPCRSMTRAASSPSRAPAR